MATHAPGQRPAAVTAASPAPVTVIVGEEELLVERAVTAVLGPTIAARRRRDRRPGPDVHDVRAAEPDRRAS